MTMISDVDTLYRELKSEEVFSIYESIASIQLIKINSTNKNSDKKSDREFLRDADLYARTRVGDELVI